MSLEHKQTNVVDIENNKNEIRQNFIQSVELCLGGYNPQDIKSKALPFLNEILVAGLKGETDIQVGGSTTELMSGLIDPNEYWGTKEQFPELLPEITENIDSGERSPIILAAINLLSFGDSDFDFYVTNKEKLKNIFEKIRKNYGQNSKIKENDFGGMEFNLAISNNIDLMVYWGPAYKGSHIDRTHLQLKDKKNNPLFHVDLTALPETELLEAFERRVCIGDIHDNCRGEVTVENEEIIIKIDKDKLPQAKEASKMIFSNQGDQDNQNNKDIKSIIEITFREMRKKIMHFSSTNNQDRNDFEISRIFPLLDIDSIFHLREISFGNKKLLKNLFEAQSPYQKQMIYQEMFLMAQTDPYSTIIFLQDSGFDALFFDRHLNRREVLSLLSSTHLGFSPSNQEKKISQKIKNSRENYLKLDNSNPQKYGLKGFISAIGQVLGNSTDLGYKQNFELHFKNGLEIFSDPENKVRPLKFLKSNRDLDSKEREILTQINFGGGLTERGLHHLLNQNNPKKYPFENKFDQEEFSKILFGLKKTGLIEAAKRIVKLPSGEEVESLFYFPCFDSTKISKILLQTPSTNERNKMADFFTSLEIDTVEAALSINQKDILHLKDSQFWDEIVSIIGPEPALELVKYQIELIESQKEVIRAGKFANYLDLPQVRKK